MATRLVALWLLLVLAARADDLVARGRAVYVAEGCIHCHSQYVRPDTADTELWGPAKSIAEHLRGAPPLLGNRRQGPDLQNVAARRPEDWLREHLKTPRKFVPGSRMPSYVHLFRASATPTAAPSDGEALVAYLLTLRPGER